MSVVEYAAPDQYIDNVVFLYNFTYNSDDYIDDINKNNVLQNNLYIDYSNGLYCDGSNYLEIEHNDWFNFSNKNYTIEFLIQPGMIANSSSGIIAHKSNNVGWQFYFDRNNLLFFELNTLSICSQTFFDVDQWYYVILTKENNWYRLYVNGRLEGEIYFDESIDSSASLLVGTNYLKNSFMNCYIKCIRFTENVVRYSIPDSLTENDPDPYVNVLYLRMNSNIFCPYAEEIVLLCQSNFDENTNTIIDNSYSSTITNNNVINSTARTKFNKSSFYFNGNSSNLSITSPNFNFYNKDFSIEMQVFARNNVQKQSIFAFFDSTNTNGLNVSIENEYIKVFLIINNVYFEQTELTYPIKSNIWNHICFSYENGIVYLWLNHQIVTKKNVFVLPNLNLNMLVGGNSNLGWFNGYMDDIQIVNKKVSKTTNIQIPDSKKILKPNEVLYINSTENFSSPDIYSSFVVLNMRNELNYNDDCGHAVTLQGNATISTLVKKFGNGSLQFNKNDYNINNCVVIQTNNDFEWPNDFTIEFWCYLNSISPLGTVLYDGNTTNCFQLFVDSNGNLNVNLGGVSTLIGGTSAFNIQTKKWNHIAVTRYSGILRVFINGTLIGQTNYTNTFNQPFQVYLGRSYDNNLNNVGIDGYFDDIRITKGIARYVESFNINTIQEIPPCYSIINDDAKSHKIILFNVNIDKINNHFLESSLNFNGNNSYLVIKDQVDNLSLGMNDFAISFWIKPKSFSTTQCLFDFRQTINDKSIYAILQTNGKIAFYYATSLLFITDLNLNNSSWNFIDIERKNNILYIYINEKLSNLIYFNNEIVCYQLTIGKTIDNLNILNAYVEEFRITNKDNQYVIIDAKPLIPIDAQSYLYNSVDLTPITQNGNVILTSENKKYGNTSVKFGSNNYNYLRTIQKFNYVLNPNFTIDFWVYVPTNLLQSSWGNVIFADQSDIYQGFAIALDSNTRKVKLRINGFLFETNSIINQNTWTHVAVVNIKNKLHVYVNGIKDTNIFDLLPYPKPYQFYIGNQIGNWGNQFNGYIDDLRVTNTVRWTQNFTPHSREPTTTYWQFETPKFKYPTSKTIFRGKIYDNNGNPMKTTIMFYNQNTGEFLGSVESDDSGYYSIDVNAPICFAVILDNHNPPIYQPMVFTNLIPVEYPDLIFSSNNVPS